MAKIEFKSKIRTMHSAGGEELYRYIDVPALDRKHCDMAAFRNHPKYGGYANSDLFKGMLSHIRKGMFGDGGKLRLDAIPAGVTVDASGFLAVVFFDV
jgi:hypothetical protein